MQIATAMEGFATLDKSNLVGEEELFEGGVVGRHGDGELGLVQVTGESFGERGSLPNGFLDDIGEFGRVRCCENEPLRRLRVLFAESLPGMNADGSVWIRDIAVAIPDRVHFLEGLLVGGAVSPNFLAYIFETVAAKVEKTRKIVGIADVHGV